MSKLLFFVNEEKLSKQIKKGSEMIVCYIVTTLWYGIILGALKYKYDLVSFDVFVKIILLNQISKEQRIIVWTLCPEKSYGKILFLFSKVWRI